MAGLRKLSGAVIALLASVTLTHDALGKSCEKEMLETVSSEGDILVMLSGSVYEVMGGDEIDSALWLPPSDVLICTETVTYKGKPLTMTEIINLDENGEKVSVTKLH